MAITVSRIQKNIPTLYGDENPNGQHFGAAGQRMVVAVLNKNYICKGGTVWYEDKTDDVQTDNSDTLASAKAVKTVDDKITTLDNRVQTDVPVNAVFTDTVYDDTAIQTSVASKANDAEFQAFKLANDQAVILKGSWDATTSFPANTEAGYKYIVSVDGTQDGIDFKVGDSLISLLDDASTTTYLNNWHHQPLASESGFTDITWAALVALTTREAGQKYNITTANPNDSIVYGKVVLTGSGDTFIYVNQFNENQLITIPAP